MQSICVSINNKSWIVYTLGIITLVLALALSNMSVEADIFSGQSFRGYVSVDSSGAADSYLVIGTSTISDSYLSIGLGVSPTVTTDVAIATTGQLRGTIANTGGINNTIRGFRWGTSSGVYTSSWTESGSFSIGSFTYTIPDLKYKTYYVQAMAYSPAGWGYGSELNFLNASPLLSFVGILSLITCLVMFGSGVSLITAGSVQQIRGNGEGIKTLFIGVIFFAIFLILFIAFILPELHVLYVYVLNR